MKTKPYLPLLLLVSAALLSAPLALAKHPNEEKKLLFAVDLIRHGDRTPVIEIPGAPHHWPEGLGQLTPLGMQQEYNLGKKFHHRYIEQEKLLPRSYHPGIIYVRSTDVDRTLMSAECVLMGLYPLGSGPFLHSSFLMNSFALPFGFQPIPIHTVSQESDTLLLSHHHRSELEKGISSIPACRERERQLQPYFPSWSKATGVPLHDAIDLEALGDALYIYRLKHLAMPKGLSIAESDTIIQACKVVFKQSITAMDQSGKNLLLEIAHHLEEATEKKSPLKYILYSAHDSSIMSLLAAMNVSIQEIPHYSSDLNIALYEDGKDRFEVQVTLNDHPLQLISGTGTEYSLQEFLKFVDQVTHKNK
jgi:acid phosphatase